MSVAIVLVTALLCIAAMLTAIMLVAWHSFGRPRHAIVWAAGFGVATIQWLVNLLLRVATDGGLALYAAVYVIGCLSSALIATGFLLRSGARAGVLPVMIAAAAAALVVLLSSFAIPHDGIRDATGLGFGGVMMIVSAISVARSLRTASLPERAVMAMLLLFAVLSFAMVGAALRQGASGHGEAFALFRGILALLHPPIFTGVGLVSVLLVAADLAENMRMLATADALTGIYNRRGFDDAAERAIRNAQRQGQPLVVVLADIDNFKAINDRYGHSVGDRALRHFASRLERLVRRGDVIGRIGGEEFALLLVNTRASDAIEVVERIRRDIASMPVGGPDRIVMTASFGVTGLRPGDISLTSLISRADRALYRSKLEGRDRVTAAEDIEDAVPAPAPAI